MTLTKSSCFCCFPSQPGRGCNITSKQYVRPDKKGKKGSAKKFPLTTDESENNVRAHLPHRLLAKTFFPLLMLWVDQGYKAFHCHREPFFRHQLNHGYARISPGFRQMVRSNKTWIRLNWIDSIKTRTKAKEEEPLLLLLCYHACMGLEGLHQLSPLFFQPLHY